MHDWWSPLIGMIIGFLFAWGVFELTEHRRRKRAQAGVRRALVAELGQAELVVSAIVFNLSIGTDHVADAVQELRWILQLGTERILRAGVLDLTTEEIEALRHLQGQSDEDTAEILRTLSPGQRARPLLELPARPGLRACQSAGWVRTHRRASAQGPSLAGTCAGGRGAGRRGVAPAHLHDGGSFRQPRSRGRQPRRNTGGVPSARHRSRPDDPRRLGRAE